MDTKRTLSCFLAALSICLLAGCGGKEAPLPDTYVPGSDYQLYLRSNDNLTMYLTAENTCLRLLSRDPPPFGHFTAVRPTLEDVYLWLVD